MNGGQGWRQIAEDLESVLDPGSRTTDDYDDEDDDDEEEKLNPR